MNGNQLMSFRDNNRLWVSTWVVSICICKRKHFRKHLSCSDAYKFIVVHHLPPPRVVTAEPLWSQVFVLRVWKAGYECVCQRKGENKTCISIQTFFFFVLLIQLERYLFFVFFFLLCTSIMSWSFPWVGNKRPVSLVKTHLIKAVSRFH